MTSAGDAVQAFLGPAHALVATICVDTLSVLSLAVVDAAVRGPARPFDRLARLFRPRTILRPAPGAPAAPGATRPPG
jgi:hypothetical protein